MTCTSDGCTAQIPRDHRRCLSCSEKLLAERDAAARAPKRPAHLRKPRR